MMMAPRREFLTACGALALAVPPVAAADFAADDPHLEWERRIYALREHRAGLPDIQTTAEEDALQPLYDEEWALEDSVAGTPARTLAGIEVQIRTVLHTIDEGGMWSEREAQGMRNAVRSLQRLDGRA